MSKFGIKKTERHQSVDYIMHDVTLDNGLSPVFSVKPASDTNKPYISALLRQNAQARRNSQVTLKVLDRNRQDDIELYAKYIITGWQNVIDVDGVAVEYSSEEGKQFLTEIVKDNSWIFDNLRVFCSDMHNFINDLEDEELIKN